MKKRSREILCGLGGILFGGALVFALLKANPGWLAASPPEKPQIQTFAGLVQKPDFDSSFDDDFFRGQDPFEEMRRLREQMGIGNQAGSLFDDWFGHRFGGRVNEITQREDDANIYYDITIDGLTESKVSTRIQNGHVIISGETKKEEESGGARTFSRSSFQRSLPLPVGVHAELMEMKAAPGQLTLRFPKKK